MGRLISKKTVERKNEFDSRQHMIWHLAPNGRIGMVLANGSLSSQSGGEGEIRKNIINADLVDCIVAMPTQLRFIFNNTLIVGNNDNRFTFFIEFVQ